MIPAPFQILIGKAQEQLRTLPAGSVHQVITSPPYWALRDYGVEGQLGLEPTPELYIADLVAVFDDVCRVLRDDGTLWVNLGDTYATGAGGAKQAGGGKQGANWQGTAQQLNRMPQKVAAGNKLLIPQRFAIAMQAAGWVLRSEIIWHKRSPMPESQTGQRWVRCRVKIGNSARAAAGTHHAEANAKPNGARNGAAFDSQAKFEDCPGCAKCAANDGLVLRRGKWRPTTAHEHIYLFSKPGDYFCDGDGSAEPTTGNAHARGDGLNPKARSIDAGTHRGVSKQNDHWSGAMSGLVETRNMRSVWTLSSEPCKEAHFATFPSELVRRCLIAGTSPAGCCPECGNQYAPVVRSERVATRPGTNSKVPDVAGWQRGAGSHSTTQHNTTNGQPHRRANGDGLVHDDSPYHDTRGSVVGNRDPKRHTTRTVIDGYRPTCQCNAGAAVPSVILDPFAGAGTTLQVASHYGRRSIGVELNPDYAAMAEQRIQTPPRCMLREKDKAKKRRTISKLQELLVFESFLGGNS